MTRFLLTMLALLTGLSTSGTPAHARVSAVGEAEIGVVELSRGANLLAAQSSVAAVRTEASESHRTEAASYVHEQAVLVPTVLTGIDRARE